MSAGGDGVAAAEQTAPEPVRNRCGRRRGRAHAADDVGLGVRNRLLGDRGVREVRQRQPCHRGDPGHRPGPTVLAADAARRSSRHCASPCSAPRPVCSSPCRCRCGRPGSGHRTGPCVWSCAASPTSSAPSPTSSGHCSSSPPSASACSPGCCRCSSSRSPSSPSSPPTRSTASIPVRSRPPTPAVLVTARCCAPPWFRRSSPPTRRTSLYAFELNLRASSVIGLVGAGGIGQRIFFLRVAEQLGSGVGHRRDVRHRRVRRRPPVDAPAQAAGMTASCRHPGLRWRRRRPGRTRPARRSTWPSGRRSGSGRRSSCGRSVASTPSGAGCSRHRAICTACSS